MRVPLLFAAMLALSACGSHDQKDNNQSVDENLTAENIVSNDVTAIDAVTGDAANMAADVDMNYGGIDENETTTAPSGGAPRISGPARKPSRGGTPAPAPVPQDSTTATANGD